MPREERIGAIDELRGLALVAVILSHIGLVYGLDTPLAFALAVPAFGVGVDLFFVISGFVISNNIETMTAEAGGDRLRGAVSFWLRRFFRIVAPTWVTVAAIAATRVVIFGDGGSWGDLVSASGFYANFYWADCVRNNSNCGDPLIDSHFWSLALEMQFYALAPALAAAPRRLAVGICAIVVVCCAALSFPIGGFLWSIRPEGFLLGMALAREARQRDSGFWGAVPSVSLGQAGYWLLIAAMFARLAGSAGLGLSVVGVIFAAILAGRVKLGASGCVFGRLLRKAGEASFAAYLVHLPLLTFVHALLAGRAPPLASLALATGAVIGASYLWDAVLVAPAAKLARWVSAARTINEWQSAAKRCN